MCQGGKRARGQGEALANRYRGMTADPQQQGLSALRKYEYAPLGASPAAGHAPTSPSAVRRDEPRALRVYLPYVLLIVGGLVFGMPIPGSGVSRYLQGEVHVVALGVIIGCGVVLARRELAISTYLHWTGALVAAAIVGHVAVGMAFQRPSYPAEVQARFLAGCHMSWQGTTSQCVCALNWFESHESLTQFNADIAELTTSGGSTWDVRGALYSCGLDLGRLGGG